MSLVRSTTVPETVLVLAGQVTGVHPAVMKRARRLVRQIPSSRPTAAGRTRQISPTSPCATGLPSQSSRAVPAEHRRPPAGRQSFLVAGRPGQVRDHHRGLGLAVVLREDSGRTGGSTRPADNGFIAEAPVVTPSPARTEIPSVRIRVVHQRVDHRQAPAWWP